METEITTEELIHRLEEHLTAESLDGLVDPELPPFKRYRPPAFHENPYIHYFC